MTARILAPALAILTFACVAHGEGVVTITGDATGNVTILEKDGAVIKLTPENTSFLNRLSKEQVAERNRKAREMAEEERREDEQARLKADRDAEAQRRRTEEAEAKAAEEAALREEELKAKEEARRKEIARYNDKDYSYGPGSADDKDQTGAIVRTRERLHESALDRRDAAREARRRK